MADEFIVKYPTGNTVYITAERISDGLSYTNALTDNGDDTYTGSMDASAPLGQYVCRAYKQLGASADPDSDTLLHPGETRIWSGSEFDFDKAVQAALGTYKSSIMTFGGLRS